MVNDDAKRAARLTVRYRRIQSARWDGVTDSPKTSGAGYVTEPPEYPDSELRAAIEAFRRRKLAQLAATLRELGVQLPPPTDNELENGYDFLISARLCVAAEGDAPNALKHVPYMAADYPIGLMTSVRYARRVPGA